MSDREKVTITVSGPVGVGKSALCIEIDILCRALGLDCEWAERQSVLNETGGDTAQELDIYKPSVTIVEKLDPPND